MTSRGKESITYDRVGCDIKCTSATDFSHSFVAGIDLERLLLSTSGHVSSTVAQPKCHSKNRPSFSWRLQEENPAKREIPSKNCHSGNIPDGEAIKYSANCDEEHNYFFNDIQIVTYNNDKSLFPGAKRTSR